MTPYSKLAAVQQGRVTGVEMGFFVKKLIAGVLAGGLLTGSLQAAEVQPHRAIYTLKLDKATGSSGIAAVSGQMMYEWQDACDAWVTEQRYRMRMVYGESDDLDLTISFVTWEAKDGSRYRFAVKRWHDGEIQEELSGTAVAEADGSGGKASFTLPGKSAYELPAKVMFPTFHTLALLEAAAKGENFFVRPVFDGGTDDGASEATAAIGLEIGPDTSAANPLLHNRAWPVRIAFFTGKEPDEPGEGRPDYEMGMVVQENGIARSLLMDYGDFTVKALLSSLEALPKGRC